MKKLLVLAFLFINLCSFSQNYEIPHFEFEEKSDMSARYIRLLNLKDKNQLFMKIGFDSEWGGGIHSNVIVYQNDGKVFKYEVFHPFRVDDYNKITVKNKDIDKKNYQFYWSFLNDCFKNNRLKIQNYLLNITRKSGESGSFQSMVVSDGSNCTFEISRGAGLTSYSSYAPESYIENKYPGYEERQKFVDLIRDVQNLIKKY